MSDAAKTRTEGVVDEAKGRAKAAFGDLTGDKQTQAEGHMDQASGKLKQGVADAKDKLSDATKKLDDR